MAKAILFGGTTEGRELCEFCAEAAIPVLYCVATADGARAVGGLPDAIVSVRVGRMDGVEMGELLQRHRPELVIDATHPYAEEVSRNIDWACGQGHLPLLRVARETAEEAGDKSFYRLADLIEWLETVPGNIFVTTGSSSAPALCRLTGFQNRVWLRVLPGMEQMCLDLGYLPEHIISMQGPFSEDVNRSQFAAAQARILVTKSTGKAGGYLEKLKAAQSLGIFTAVLARPEDSGGISLEEAKIRLAELRV